MSNPFNEIEEMIDGLNNEADRKVSDNKPESVTYSTSAEVSAPAETQMNTERNVQNQGTQINSSAAQYSSGAQGSYYGQRTAYPAGTQQAAQSAASQPPVYQPPQTNMQQNRASYTWSTGGTPQNQVPYYGYPKKVKKPSRHIGIKIVAMILCCAIVSLSSVGGFALLIKNGVVNVNAPKNSSTTAAFTINQIEQRNEAAPVATIAGALTPQEIADKLIPSIVCIQSYVNTQNSPFGGFGGFGGFNDFDMEEGTEISPISEGSGIIFKKDGYIVTNAHVISGADSIKVVTSEGLTFEAEVVGVDSMTDLAVIKINANMELPIAEFGSSDDLKVADEVMAIGNPGGIQFNSSVTMGYVSALNREIVNSDNGYTLKCIQTDAAINPGNSGGALVDIYGHVIGINSSKIVATGYEGLGFAIPSNFVQAIVSDLMEYGYVKDRAMLGITGEYIDSMTAGFYGFESGMYVAGVNAEEAIASGLRKGDVITAIDGTPITSSSTISSYIANKKPGDTVKLSVSRAIDNENMTISIVLTESKGIVS